MTNAVKIELQARQTKNIETPGRGMSAHQISFIVLGLITIMAVIVA